MENKNIIPLEGPGVFLEPIKLQDVNQEYVSWLNNPSVNRYLEIRFFPQTEKTVFEYVSSFINTDGKYMWAVREKINSAMLGTITLITNTVHLTGGIGTMIGNQNAWGTLASKNMCPLVIEFAFNTLKLRRIVAHNMAANRQSNFMLQNLGFKLEGVLRKEYRLSMEEDIFVDGFNFALLKEEWDKKKSIK